MILSPLTVTLIFTLWSPQEQASVEKKNDDSDSDSSSLPSLEDEKDVGKENAQGDKKKKTEKKEKSTKSQKVSS